MPFTKDDPNINKAGRPKKGRAWADAIKEVSERVDDKTGKTHKLLVAEVLFDKAKSGDIMAIREIGNRLDGKASQQLGQVIDRPMPIPIMGGMSDPVIYEQFQEFRKSKGQEL